MSVWLLPYMVKSTLISWIILPMKNVSVHLEYMLMVVMVGSLCHGIVLTSRKDETKITHLAGQLSVKVFLTKTCVSFPGPQCSVHDAMCITTGRCHTFQEEQLETCDFS